MHEQMTTSDGRILDGSAWRDISHLKGSDYRIADGEPDIRGWKVRSRDGRIIGKVRDLLINKSHRLAEYIEVELEGDDDRRTVLPIQSAVLDEDDDEVQYLANATEALVDPSEPSQSTKDLQRDLNRFFGARREGRDADGYLVERSNETP
jgi:hypothetical protein